MTQELGIEPVKGPGVPGQCCATLVARLETAHDRSQPVLSRVCRDPRRPGSVYVRRSGDLLAVHLHGRSVALQFSCRHESSPEHAADEGRLPDCRQSGLGPAPPERPRLRGVRGVFDPDSPAHHEPAHRVLRIHTAELESLRARVLRAEPRLRPVTRPHAGVACVSIQVHGTPGAVHGRRRADPPSAAPGGRGGCGQLHAAQRRDWNSCDRGGRIARFAGHRRRAARS